MISRFLLLMALSCCDCGTLVVNVAHTSYQAEENQIVTLEWTFTPKPDSSTQRLYVHFEMFNDHKHSTLFHLHDGVEVPLKDEEFSGRVQCDKDVLRDGRIRLHVSSLRTEDSGWYRCEVFTNSGSSWARCHLTVTAADHEPEDQRPTERPEPQGTMAVLPQRPLLAVVGLLLCCVSCGLSVPDPRQRDALMRLEASMQTGGQVVLTDAEQRLDALLSKMKQEEMKRKDFPPAMHFFQARDLINNSPIFSLLQKMPKGAALHVHDFSMVAVEWLVKNVTYRPNCYMCCTDSRSIRFIFSSNWPKARPHCSPWTLLENLRAKTANTTDLDNSIMGNLTLFTDQDPESVYPSQDVVWGRFEQAFLAVWGLVTYAPVFRDYYYEGLTQLYMDNIMYLELRALLPEIYELDGSTHDTAWALKTYEEITRQFTAEHPDFFGARIIFTVHRGVDLSVMVGVVEEAMKLRRDLPDIMAGFDLVGREDSGRPLWYFREALSMPGEKGVTLPFFFHAGETDLEGTEVDQNLLDALLLNTSRIGHGFALLRHPVAKDISRKRGVAVEVCPISNQVLKLVKDLRNHPAAALMSENHPMVISSDDPAMFGSSGLSHDFYEAFVGFGGSSSHLGSLKQLAMNSIRYSSLSPKQQEKALALWQRRWDKFVSENAL
ncbi:adenosine deaminase 2-A [Notolabrus celidotus]|uniref:adenosine deaminase 2-A n=1 Tax=Notolabrus celidotus TaxID=1203425 RepID=UPI0014901BC5|nr:adenosine deaminase 2-A [Notolabrus celidotus]XP_034541198.1 adenosine deaminase 2-A [Notolabrus celidotus]XP_034541199.1 adenosine deaminase 2-A [Notolabrus celidotus]